jgi:hemolysin-activating ACP:hemolysin acyltransferase
VQLLQAYEKLNGNWRVRDLKNRALSERIALLKELNAMGDLEMTKQQIKDRIRPIHDIRFRQQQKPEQAKRHVHVASVLADLEESESEQRPK